MFCKKLNAEKRKLTKFWKAANVNKHPDKNRNFGAESEPMIKIFPVAKNEHLS